MTLTFPKIKLPSRITIKKPEINLGILQKTVGYIAASVSLVPPLRPIVLGITTIADISSNGKSSAYLNNGQKSNSTFNFVPGGDLVQKILNDSTKGKSGELITKYTADVKKMAIQEMNHKKNVFTNYGIINGTKEPNKPCHKKRLISFFSITNIQNLETDLIDFNNISTLIENAT